MKKSILLLIISSVFINMSAQSNLGERKCLMDKVTAFTGLTVGLSWHEGSIEWTPVPNAILYEVEINSIGLYGNSDIINTYIISGTQNTMVIDLFIHNWFGNNNGKYISFKVRALCNCERGEWSEWSDNQCFLFGYGIVPCGSYNGKNSNDIVKVKTGIYPNPVDSSINLSDVIIKKGMTYEIINLENIIIKSGKIERNQLEIEDIKEGIYLFVIKQDNQIISSIKFLKN